MPPTLGARCAAPVRPSTTATIFGRRRALEFGSHPKICHLKGALRCCRCTAKPPANSVLAQITGEVLTNVAIEHSV
jgi:hypothetical protein